MDEKKQIDLFNDWEDARVFSCVVGAYIGHFNRNDEDNPINRLSDFYTDENSAQVALNAKEWTPAL